MALPRVAPAPSRPREEPGRLPRHHHGVPLGEDAPLKRELASLLFFSSWMSSKRGSPFPLPQGLGSNKLKRGASMKQIWLTWLSAVLVLSVTAPGQGTNNAAAAGATQAQPSQQPPAPRVVDLKAEDGTPLKASF